MKNTKLPNDIFSDSPLRATTAKSVVLVQERPIEVPVAPPTAPTIQAAVVPAVESRRNSEGEGGAEAEGEVRPADVARIDAPRPKAPAKVEDEESASAPLVKLTLYLSKEQVQFIEDEVYTRKRAGERGISNSDLAREILEDHMARRARKLSKVATQEK